MKIKHIRKYHLLYSKSEQLIITNRFEKKKKTFRITLFSSNQLTEMFFFYFLKKTNKNLYYLQKIEQHTKK